MVIFLKSWLWWKQESFSSLFLLVNYNFFEAGNQENITVFFSDEDNLDWVIKIVQFFMVVKYVGVDSNCWSYE